MVNWYESKKQIEKGEVDFDSDIRRQYTDWGQPRPGRGPFTVRDSKSTGRKLSDYASAVGLGLYERDLGHNGLKAYVADWEAVAKYCGA